MIRLCAAILVFLMGAPTLSSCSSARKNRPLSPAAQAVSDRVSISALGNLGINLGLEKRTLPNGLTVLMVEDHTVPVISYQSWFKVGSIDEKAGYTGMAHLFEHLMFKGTERYGPKEFFQQLEARGASVNAYTTRDYTVFHETFTPNLLDKVIDMESDRLAHLKLDQAVLQTERQVVFEERSLRTDNSLGGKLQEALWSLAYQVHPYRYPVVGFSEDLLRIRVENLKEFFSTFYQPGNLVLVIVGDFKAESTFEAIKKAYGAVPGHKRDARRLPEEPEQNEERRLILHDNVTSERVAIAYHVSAADNDDSYVLDVLSNILFSGTNSRAYQSLVENKQLAVGISGVAFTPTYPGLFMISAVMKGETPAAVAETELDRLIKTVQVDGVTDDEIRFAVRQLTVQMVDGVLTSHGLGTLIGTVMSIFGDPKRYATDLSKYLAVTSEDVKRVSNKYLYPNNRTVVTLKPLITGKTGVSK